MTIGVRRERIDLGGNVQREYRDLDVDSLDVRVSASADAVLAGRVGTLRIAASGSCSIDARDLRADSVTVEASGSATVHAYAGQEHCIDASGSVKIYLYGEGEITRQDVTGSARVIKGKSDNSPGAIAIPS